MDKIEELTFRGTVYPWQCDHIGHMNVMFYTSRFDEATWSFFSDYGLTRQRFNTEGLGMAALEQNVQYLREAHPGDGLRIYTRLINATHKVVTCTHRMIDSESGNDCAIMTQVSVCLDTTSRKSRPFPDDIQERFRIALRA